MGENRFLMLLKVHFFQYTQDPRLVLAIVIFILP